MKLKREKQIRLISESAGALKKSLKKRKEIHFSIFIEN